MIRQSAMRTAVLVVFGGLVAGCSETGFQDFLGAGKYAPDETQVSVNQPLSVPPDLQLRPPLDSEPQTVASEPAGQPAGEPASGQLQQPQDLAAAPQPQQITPQPVQSQQQTAGAEPQDVYARWGVSRHHPDGREKTQQELNEEMRQKKLEAQRQQDPNYGTIWNLGSIWSDG